VKSANPRSFLQYGLLSARLDTETPGIPQPLFINTNAPSSAFICGNQGLGSSYTLCCILEDNLYKSTRILKLAKPLAGLLFHYDAHSSGSVCEAAYLSSHIPVTVLYSPSNI